MNKVEKIKAEIKRRYNILKNIASPENKDYYDGKIEAYKETLDFLNSLEEPVSNDLEEAATKYARKQVANPDYPTYNDEYELESAFEVGAKWGMEQAEVKIQAQSIDVAHGCPKEPISNDLEEELDKYFSRFKGLEKCYWNWRIDSINIHAQGIYDFAKHFAQWQKEQIIDKAYEWLKSYRQDTPDGTGYISGIVNDKTIEDFKQAMEK